jgi:hypothetical protein
MKCFLHIGTEKTASTTIQAFFRANTTKLLEKGFIYTMSAGLGNNQALSVAAYDLARRDEYTRFCQIDSVEKMASFQKDTIANLKKEIQDAAKTADKVIFSSEHLQSRLTSHSELLRLKSILLELGMSEVSIIVYLRRPADIANSLYSTALKCGAHSLEAPPPPSDTYFSNVCHHKNTLLRFASVFGRSALIPRLFERRELVNQSIIDDIMSVIGMPPDADYILPPNLNEALSPLGAKLLKRLNQHIPALAGGRPNPVRSNLLDLINLHFSDGKYVMPKFLYEAYDKTFRESNEWVCREFFPGRSSLFSDAIPEESSLAISDDELDKFAAFIAQAWKTKQGRILQLSNQLKALEKLEKEPI